MPQHSEFEEQFHDNLLSQDDALGSRSERYMGNEVGQKALLPSFQNSGTPGVGARLALSIASLLILCLLLVVELGVAAQTSNSAPFIVYVAAFFSLIFTGATITLNVIFNRKH